MYCSSCGSLISEGQSFCPNCGAPVSQPAPQPAVQVQQPQPSVQPVVQAQPSAQPIAQPVAQPVSPQPAAASPARVKKSKGFAIAGFILGLETLPISWVIFVNILSIFTGLAGVILSIIGLTRKNGALKVLAIIGLITSFVGMVYSILSWATFWSHDVYEFMEPVFELLY
jgi:hypothetical protein